MVLAKPVSGISRLRKREFIQGWVERNEWHQKQKQMTFRKTSVFPLQIYSFTKLCCQSRTLESTLPRVGGGCAEKCVCEEAHLARHLTTDKITHRTGRSAGVLCHEITGDRWASHSAAQPKHGCLCHPGSPVSRCAGIPSARDMLEKHNGEKPGSADPISGRRGKCECVPGTKTGNDRMWESIF